MCYISQSVAVNSGWNKRGGGGDEGAVAPLFFLVFLNSFCFGNRLSSGIIHSIVLINHLKVCLPKP